MPTLLNAGQKYCRMLRGAFIKLPFVIKIFVLSIFELLFYTGFTAVPFKADKEHETISLTNFPACKESKS